MSLHVHVPALPRAGPVPSPREHAELTITANERGHERLEWPRVRSVRRGPSHTLEERPRVPLGFATVGGEHSLEHVGFGGCANACSSGHKCLEQEHPRCLLVWVGVAQSSCKALGVHKATDG